MNKNDLKFTVVLDKSYSMDLDADLDIDKANINKELGEQPGKFAWYGMLSELAKANTSRIKSTIDATARKNAANTGEKLSEARIEALIATNEAYIKAKNDEGNLIICKQAFEQRKDMLVSMASNMRSEIDDDLKVLKEKARKSMKA